MGVIHQLIEIGREDQVATRKPAVPDALHASAHSSLASPIPKKIQAGAGETQAESLK